LMPGLLSAHLIFNVPFIVELTCGADRVAFRRAEDRIAGSQTADVGWVNVVEARRWRGTDG